jgi:two-component sensor histidine kinase
MNIDNRLEALAQSVEVLYQSSKGSDRRVDQLRQSVAGLVANSDRIWMLHTSQDRTLSLQERRLDEHDNRLHNLDGGQLPNG